jgi:long-chain acyl-CoA synthetase
VGPAYKGVEGRIASDTGEIQMRSAALMMGYYKDPVQTKAAFTADGWL